ncbi:acyltransferase [Mucilaginibacter terrenus]|nr:acyltransferase family protein [Mucilaginibacter terrenus]
MKFSETVEANRGNISWMNNLRLIAILAVVALHTASPLLFAYNSVSVSDWIAGDLYNALTRFAVPVFVMITGALLLGREYDLFVFLRKRLGRLILPFLFWSLVYITYRYYNEEFVFTGKIWTDVRFVLHQLKTGSYYHMWYIYQLIGLYLFIPVLSKFVRNATEKELLYFLAVWFFAMLFSRPYLSSLETAVDLHNFSGYIGYMVLGYYVSNKKVRLYGIELIAALLFICLATIIAAGTYYRQVKFHELSTYFYEPLGPFVILLSASALIKAKNTVVKIAQPIQVFLDNASKSTLGIYFCHPLVLNFFELNRITYAAFNSIVSIPTIALACFLISWLLIWVMRKIPLLKYLVE